MFSDKSNAVDTKWKIETFKKGKKYIANFIIEFEILAIKAETDNIHTIFLLKNNIRSNIIKTILGYLPIAAPESLKEWKIVIISVEQGYEFIEDKQDYKTELRITYGERGAPMNIVKAKDNYDRNRKPRYLNYNIYRYIVNFFRKPKKEKETRKYYKYNKLEYLVKNFRSGQKMKNKSIQDNSDDKDEEDNDKKKGFVRDSE